MSGEQRAELNESLLETVRRLLDDYSDDHNWAIWAAHELRLAVHRAEGCQVFRKDCPSCQAELTQETAR